MGESTGKKDLGWESFMSVLRQVSQSLLSGQEQGVEFNPGMESGARFMRKHGSSMNLKLGRPGAKM